MLSGTDYVKTIVNGLKQWVKKQIRAARPDWNQNDPKAPNYVENRIAYVDTHITHAINPEPFDRENSWQKFSGFMLEKGKTYHITVNGRRYTCVARLFSPNDTTRLISVGWQLSNIDRGYDDVPFCIYNHRDRVGGDCCALCSGDDRNLYVEEYTRTFTDIKQLPEECVPHAPIYLTTPTDEDLCNAILGADGSIVMVTTASGATQVFYPCHESVTEPRTWVGTVIGGEYDKTCIYKVVVPPTGLPSIKYLEDEGVIPSSTPNSTKKFKITVDDSGVISATEVVE